MIRPPGGFLEGGIVGIRDLFEVNADLLTDTENGLAEDWAYTAPGGTEAAFSFSGILDQSNAQALDRHPTHGDEQTEHGVLEAPASLEFAIRGTVTRAADETAWRILGIVSRDRDLQALEISRTINRTARQAVKRNT